ncbi:hypothetical protein J6590_094708 [Homalodisca vitripennis]|nr:hypothetical protein J6590_094708 [Homalodisca vitripennis]
MDNQRVKVIEAYSITVENEQAIKTRETFKNHNLNSRSSDVNEWLVDADVTSVINEDLAYEQIIDIVVQQASNEEVESDERQKGEYEKDSHTAAKDAFETALKYLEQQSATIAIVLHMWARRGHDAAAKLLLRCRLYLVNRGVASSFHGPLQFWEQEKVTGARSGEYGGCGIISVLFLAKKSRASSDV